MAEEDEQCRYVIDTIMKRLLLMIIISFPCFTNGQVDLCHDCAVTIHDIANPKICCEECLQNLYINKTRQNITHGKLSDYYKYEEWTGFIPFPDTLLAHFSVLNIEHKKGYCLKDSVLTESHYRLVYLKCEDNRVPTGTSIILIVNDDDSSSYDIGRKYCLKLLPYFKRNQDFRIIDGERFQMIGQGTMFDLVYKEWLIVMLPVRANYFFLSSEQPH